MQYYANPNEMVAMVKERHTQLLREAEMMRRIYASQPAGQPLATRLNEPVQSLARAVKARWSQARTIFKLAPAE
jgi:hypothetical protein